MVEQVQDKRLDHLHAIVQRLATNSFTIKGWAVTVASAFLGFSIKDAKPSVALVGMIPIAIFWIIDAYYLAAERYFRDRYNEVLRDPVQGTMPIVGNTVRPVDLVHAL